MTETGRKVDFVEKATGSVAFLVSETRFIKSGLMGVDVARTSYFVKCDVGGDGMTTTGGCLAPPMGWPRAAGEMRRGRRRG